jgi:hypothetical protein
MIRMLILGYVFAIRSERALCPDVQVNFAYRWFCGLSIKDKIPSHSAFYRLEQYAQCFAENRIRPSALGLLRSVIETSRHRSLIWSLGKNAALKKVSTICDAMPSGGLCNH